MEYTNRCSLCCLATRDYRQLHATLSSRSIVYCYGPVFYFVPQRCRILDSESVFNSFSTSGSETLKCDNHSHTPSSGSLLSYRCFQFYHFKFFFFFFPLSTVALISCFSFLHMFVFCVSVRVRAGASINCAAAAKDEWRAARTVSATTRSVATWTTIPAW